MTMEFSKMRAGVFGLCMAAATAMPLLAQDAMQGPPPPRGGGAMKMMQDLNLTPDQQKQVKSIMMESRRKQMEMKRDDDAKIRALLNDEQKAKFDQMQSQMRQGKHGKGGPGMAPPPAEQ